jgi:hypothetical protein
MAPRVSEEGTGVSQVKHLPGVYLVGMMAGVRESRRNAAAAAASRA